MNVLFHPFDDPFPLKKIPWPGFALPQLTWIYKPESGTMVWIPDHLQSPPNEPAPQPANRDSRKSQRHRYGRVIEAYPLRPKTSDNAYHLTAQDISRDGLCLKTPEPFSVGQIFLLGFKVAAKKTVHAPARVVWSQKKTSGLEFLSTDGLEEFLDALAPSGR